MKRSSFFAATLVLIVAISSSSAQEVIPASGGNAEGSGGSVSYSVGQLFYKIYPGTDGSVAEGVQQPYEISVVTSIIEAEGIDLIISAFPNPVTDHLILRVEQYDPENLSFQLFDVHGRMVQIKEVVDNETIIDMTGLSSAIYILKIVDGSEEIKTFRIVKF